MSSAPRIYVDVDDVLSETTRALVCLAEQLFGRRIHFEDVLSFDLGRSFGLTPQEHGRLMEAAHRPELLESLDPVPGAAAALEGFAARGCRVAVVTGRPAWSNPSSLRWLERHRIRYSSFDSLDKYTRHGPDEASGHSLTLARLLELDLALAIEDSLEMAVLLAERSSARVALFDRPWNRDVREIPPATLARIARVRDWPELLAHVQSLPLLGQTV